MRCSAVFLLCLLACSVNAQQKCCTAEQYEVKGFHTTYAEKGWVHRRMDIVNIYFPKLSIDHTNRKYAMQEVQLEKNISFTTIIDANEKIAYMFGAETKYCRKIKLHKARAMNNRCIPEEAEYMGSARIGPEQGGLYSDTFGLARRDERYEGFVSISVFREQCIMAYVGTQGEVRGRRFADTMAFSDYTAGIKDRSVFTVPSFCQERKVEMEGDTVDKVNIMADMFSG